MYCENCKNREASFHITEISNGEQIDKHLCGECAREYEEKMKLSFFPQITLPFIFGGFFGQEAGQEISKDMRTLKCDNCGMNFADFNKLGRLGCTECYRNLQPTIGRMIKRIHGNSAHSGKIPRRGGKEIALEREIADVQAELERAVAAEKYEEAAKWRDRLKELKETNLSEKEGENNERQAT